MAFSYLKDGKTLEGVTAASINFIINESNFSYSSELSLSACSSLNDSQEQHQLIFRRLGISSQDFARHILKFINDHHIWFTLDASRNQITSIPSTLQCFANLTRLNLSCNNISVIPKAILGLDKLQQLYLSENQIDYIPEAMPICLTELIVLNLDSNRIKVLPESIGQWKKLREFRLGSEYGGNLIEIIPDSVSDMQALVELDLSFNDLQTTGTFQGLQKLKYLNLSHNCIKYMPMLTDCSQLTTLDLSDNLLQTIPYATANCLLRLMLNYQLQLLNLSDNRLDIIPTELLDQTRTQIIIQGNPLTSYRQEIAEDVEEEQDDNADEEPQDINLQQNNTQLNHTVRSIMHTAIPMMDYHRHIEEIFSMEEENAGTHNIQTEEDNDLKEDGNQASYLLHSLREIALRAIVLEGDQLLLSEMPEHLAEDIQENLRLCFQCHSPFLHEWVSTAQLRTYQAHRSVARQIRFCGTVCWLVYREMLQQEALATQSEVHLRQQQEDALAYIAQHRNVLEPDSFEWIMAASLAATAQEEHADLLANVVMMM
jgi:Leucine-rich repeat (LRR) protein